MQIKAIQMTNKYMVWILRKKNQDDNFFLILRQ
jgi:hypothetical protein